MIFHFVLSNDLLYKSTEAKHEKFESHLGGLSDEMMAPYVLREFYAKLLFLFYCFKISSNKSQGYGPLLSWSGSCYQLDSRSGDHYLTRDASGRVELNQVKNDCSILKKLSNMYYYM